MTILSEEVIYFEKSGIFLLIAVQAPMIHFFPIDVSSNIVAFNPTNDCSPIFDPPPKIERAPKKQCDANHRRFHYGKPGGGAGGQRGALFAGAAVAGADGPVGRINRARENVYANCGRVFFYTGGGYDDVLRLKKPQ